MPKQDTDIDGVWTIDEGGKTWTLTENTAIRALPNDDGIADAAGHNTLRIFGNVLGESSLFGVDIGRKSVLFVGEAGWISGFSTGVNSDSGTIRILNHGLIEGDYAISCYKGTVENHGRIISAGGSALDPGINFFGAFGRILNDGFISGTFAVVTLKGGSVLNDRGGVIVGDRVGIEMGGTANDHSRIENHGTVRGLEFSIETSNQTSIINRGKIFGDITLGDYDDRVDTRGGVVNGTIRGGEGNDTYLISSRYTVIEDTGASFHDVVKSTDSFKLTDGLDDLYLLGNTPSFGEGNADDNMICGNKTINNLYGLDGDDSLNGREGNDLLVGGSGEDEFWFGKGFDVDRIEDFESGIDTIILPDAWARIPFGKLDIRQNGDDVIIDFHHGDRLVLLDFEKSDLDRKDFEFAA